MSAISEAAATAGNASVAEYRDSFGKAVAKNVLVVAIGLSLNYVNVCLMYTFCKHQIFYLSPRYILFFHLVVNDMIQLSASVALFILSYAVYRIGVGLCCAFILTALVTSENTPLNLACMAAECYVAVCLPLSHARLCTVRRTLLLVGAIWGASLVSTLPDLLFTLATEPARFFSGRIFCLRETAFPSPVLALKRDVTYAAYLVLVWSVLFFLYFRILFTARSANKETKKAKKARRTIVLHGVQVLLCMTMYAVPLVKGALLLAFPKNYSDSLFACYVVVQILPRAISPIIYGVRDKCFRKHLRNYIVCQSGYDSRRRAMNGSHAGRPSRRNLGHP
ncbi:odorant receptor 131-2-like isoform X2 [Stigmatopora argus]